MASLRAPALAAFRRLMQAREMAFQGDSEMLVQSRLAVREEFLRHKVRAQHVRGRRAYQLGFEALAGPRPLRGRSACSNSVCVWHRTCRMARH